MDRYSREMSRCHKKLQLVSRRLHSVTRKFRNSDHVAGSGKVLGQAALLRLPARGAGTQPFGPED